MSQRVTGYVLIVVAVVGLIATFGSLDIALLDHEELAAGLINETESIGK